MSLDHQTATRLRHEANALVTSQGIDLQEARQIVWERYNREVSESVQSAGPEPPAPVAEPEAVAAHMPQFDPTWNDTGALVRKPWRRPTNDDKARATGHVQNILGVIAQAAPRRSIR